MLEAASDCPGPSLAAETLGRCLLYLQQRDGVPCRAVLCCAVLCCAVLYCAHDSMLAPSVLKRKHCMAVDLMCVRFSLLVCDVLSVQSAGPEILVPGSDGNLQEVFLLAQDLHTLPASA